MNLRDLVGVLGHELRTPLAAILGYQELLAEGIYGDIADKQREPLDRIQHSALQLLHLIDGLQELVQAGSADADELVESSTAEVLQLIVNTARPYAAGRNVELTVENPQDRPLQRVPLQRFLRAADLALVACIKTSIGKPLALSLQAETDALSFTVRGSGLDPADAPTGEPPNGARLTAASLRLAMARATAAIASGTITLSQQPDGTSLTLRLPQRAD